MTTSGNGSKPQKTVEQVAAELRRRLERQLGPERTAAIWQDPTSVQDVVTGDDEAAAVAETFLNAWNDLPEEDAAPERGRGSGFRRGLQIALVAAVAVWSLSLLGKLRQRRPEK